MITKEQAIEYLDRVTDAYKVLMVPLFTDRPKWVTDNVYWIPMAEGLLISDASKLAEAVGKPFIRRSSSERSDVIEFHWNGVRIYDYPLHKRIAHIERG